MNQIDLKFQGYTWEDYFYVIGNKAGILVAYRGGLDSEGLVQMKEILFVDEADEINTIIESNQFYEIRKHISNKDRLFFSYAEMCQKGRAEVTRLIKNHLIFGFSKENELANLKVACKGACALFPKELLQEK